MKTWSEPLTRTSVTQALLGAAPAGQRQHCAAATTPRYRVPLSRSRRDLWLAWLWPRQLVNTAGRDPLDGVEVCPPVRGEGRLVDRRNIDRVVLSVVPAWQATALCRPTLSSSRSRNHPPQCRSARNSARRYRSSQSRSATARSPRSSSRIRSGNGCGLADPLRGSPSPGIRGNGRNSSRSRGSNPSTSDPVAARTYLGRPKVGHRRLHRVRRTSDHTGPAVTRVTASVLGD